MKNTWTRFSIVLATVLVLGGGGYGLTKYMAGGEVRTAARQLPEELRLAKEEGLPFSPQDLISEPPPKLEENAADLYLKMEQERRSAGGSSSGFLPFIKGQETTEAAEIMLRSNARWIALAERAADRPRLAWAKSDDMLVVTTFPQLASMKTAAYALLAKALVQSERGEIDNALISFKRARNIPSQMAQDPDLVSAMVSWPCENVWNLSLRRWARDNQDNSRVLSEAIKLLEETPPPASLREALRRNFLTTYSLMRDPGFLVACVPDKKPASGLSQLFNRPRSKSSLMNDEEWHDASRTRFIQYWRRIMSRLPADPLAILHKARLETFLIESESRDEDRKRGPSYLASDELCTNPGGFIDSYSRVLAERQVSRAYLSILQFRLKNGHLPKTLAEVGEFIDPFDGQSLRYKPSKETFIVYSVDKNIGDEGGIVPSNSQPLDLVAKG